jgi:hypothetical protein
VGLDEIGKEVVGWIHLDQDKEKLQASVEK